MLASTDIPEIEKTLYVRKIILSCEPYELPGDLQKDWYSEIAVRAFFTTDNELIIGTTLYTKFENEQVRRSTIKSEPMPWFNPTNMTDEEIKNKIENLLVFL